VYRIKLKEIEIKTIKRESTEKARRRKYRTSLRLKGMKRRKWI
jgi:hypothetical protein